MKRKWKFAAELAGAAGLYFLAIMPSGRHNAEQVKGQYYAHRGLHNKEKEAPENSLRAFARAVKKGYGIELDVQLTKDRIPVIFHDDTLQRVCMADGRVCDYTYEELKRFRLDGTKEQIPTLDEVLKLVDGQVPLLIEMKCADWHTAVCKKADEVLQHYRGSYTVESFSPFALLWYRINRPRICRGQLSMNFQRHEGHYGLEKFAARHLLTNLLARPDFIAYDIRDKEAVSKTICQKLFGCPAAAWTIRSKEQLRQVRPYYDAFIFEDFEPDQAGSHMSNA